MDLAHQRTGGIEIEQAAARRFGRHGLGHAMGGEDHRRIVRHLVELLHEDGAAMLQLLDDEAIVDDLMADIDRRAIAGQRLFDDLDRPIHSGAESARGGEQDAKRRQRRCHRAGLVRGQGVHYSPADRSAEPTGEYQSAGGEGSR